MGDQEVAALGAGLVRIKGLGPEDASVTKHFLGLKRRLTRDMKLVLKPIKER